MKKLSNKSLKLLLISSFLIVFLSVNIYSLSRESLKSLEENKNNSSDFISDEIEPYCEGVEYEESIKLQVKNIKNIDINISNKATWYQNLFAAYESPSSYIYDEYKNYYSAEVVFNFDSNIICKSSARVRISGDWKDHIEMSSLSTSLDIKLDSGNIENITRFKLFLPNTKRGDVEFINTSIMRELGFMTPRTNRVKVSLNNQKEVIYIFQEKVVKEFIEFNKKRESTLIETSEEFYWENRTKVDEENEFLLLFGKILNNDWVNKSNSNKFVGIKALDVYNNILFNSPASFLYYDFNNETYEQLLYFDVAMYALDSLHGLAPHNRKFYFDNIENRLYPIYYDADSQIALRDRDIVVCNDSNELTSILEYSCKNNFAHGAKTILSKINFDSNKIVSNLEEELIFTDPELVHEVFNKFILNLEEISNIGIINPNKIEEPIEKFKKNLSQLNDSDEFGFYFFNTTSNLLQSCSFKINQCKSHEINNQRLSNFLEINDKKHYLLGSSATQIKNSQITYNDILLENKVYLRIFGNDGYKIGIENKNLVINLNENQKILIHGQGVLKDWNILINNDSKFFENQDRQDKNSLTGCITLYGIHFDNTSIESNNNPCEDSINLLSVSGYINQLIVNNSKFDGVDIDFSNLTINNIDVTNSGNDCLDISYSDISITNILTNNCQDKSLSLGEDSNVRVQNLESNKSNIGIGIKDSTIVSIENFNGSSNNMCIAMYRKKQEFGPSALAIKNNACIGVTDNFIQRGQKFEQ